jgi:mannose-1-phosphate guanylyltransferase
MIAHNYVIIMAGGIGSRFWPMSRSNFPKQFHDILGTGKTLLQQTAERFEGICPKENIYIVTNKDYYGLCKEQLPYLADDQILLEPVARNTAPCIAYACYKIASKDPKANVVISPSDHVILKEEEFRRIITKGLEATQDNDILLTLGIKPHRPDTGYGYIQFHDEETPFGVMKVKTFTEKPKLDLAIEFLKSGDFVWNAGIFLWNVQAFLRAFKVNLPEMYELFEEGKETYYTPSERAFIDVAYSQCKSISIDYGIMEKSNNVYTMLSEFGWSDLGTWKSLYEICDKDNNGNVVDGNTMLYKTTNSIIKSTEKDKLVVVQGLDNYIISVSGDVVMICNKDEEQMVKEFVSDAKSSKEKRFS